MQIETVKGNANIMQIKNIVNDAFAISPSFFGERNMEFIKNAIESCYFYHWDTNSITSFWELLEELEGSSVSRPSKSDEEHYMSEQVPCFHHANYDVYTKKIYHAVVYKDIQGNGNIANLLHEVFGHVVCGYYQENLAMAQIRNGIFNVNICTGQMENEIANEGFMELISQYLADKLHVKFYPGPYGYRTATEVASCIYSFYPNRSKIIDLLLYGKYSIESIYNKNVEKDEWTSVSEKLDQLDTMKKKDYIQRDCLRDDIEESLDRFVKRYKR